MGNKKPSEWLPWPYYILSIVVPERILSACSRRRGRSHRLMATMICGQSADTGPDVTSNCVSYYTDTVVHS